MRDRGSALSFIQRILREPTGADIQASIIRVPLGNWCQTPSICTFTMPFSAARSLGSFSSAVAEGVSLMAKNKAGRASSLSPAGSRGTMSARFVPGKRAFRKNSGESAKFGTSRDPRLQTPGTGDFWRLIGIDPHQFQKILKIFQKFLQF